MGFRMNILLSVHIFPEVYTNSLHHNTLPLLHTCSDPWPSFHSKHQPRSGAVTCLVAGSSASASGPAECYIDPTLGQGQEHFARLVVS